jgi:hypothetical protein
VAARSVPSAVTVDPRAVGLLGLAVLGAAAFGALLPEQPLQALALVVLVPLAILAPVASLGLLLFTTAIVPFDTQNDLAFVGGAGTPGLLLIDVLLIVGLCRVAALVLLGKLQLRTPLVLGVAVGMIFAAALVVGIAGDAEVSEAGHEARRLGLGVGTFVLAWPILEGAAARRRLYGVLLLLGLGLGIWGLTQWLFDVQFASGGDVGVRPGVDLTSGGQGQLQGGLYAFPVAITLAFAALVSGRIRSAETRWLLGAILVLNSVSLLLTFERTFWVATAIACFVVVMRFGPEVRRAGVMWAAIGGVALLVSMAALGQVRTAGERLLSVGEYSTDNSYTYRTAETEHVIQEVMDKPLTGSGFGATITWGKQGLFSTQTTPFSHNGYAWLAWKIGVPAAAFVVALIALAALRRRAPPADEWLAMLRTGSQAALIALLVIAVTFPPFNALGITAIMGVLVAVSLQPPGRAIGSTRGPTRG